MRRIICIGNRYVAEDAAGPAVYDYLRGLALPADLELIDGGLAGLDLLRYIEGAEQVVFVDSIAGHGEPGSVLVLPQNEVAALAGSRYDHAAGLPYLLRVLPDVCEGTPPAVQLVGVAGPADETAIQAAAALALQIVGASGHEH